MAAPDSTWCSTMDCAARFAVRCRRLPLGRVPPSISTAIAANLYPQGFAHGWQAVPCVENHDIVKVGTDLRIPALADGSNHESWYARSRSRFATGLLLTAPGIPQIFMGQEFLEDKQWSWDPTSSNLIWWAGLNPGTDTARADHLRFTQDLIRLRWNYPALRGDNVNPFHVHDQNRVIAFHRWLEGTGQDVIVVATLAEDTWYNYGIGFPFAGPWREVFNSDVYDNWVNPIVAGNGGGYQCIRPAAAWLPSLGKHSDPRQRLCCICTNVTREGPEAEGPRHSAFLDLRTTGVLRGSQRQHTFSTLQMTRRSTVCCFGR